MIYKYVSEGKYEPILPEDATNGEVINMVFPDLAIIKETHSIYVFQGRIMIMRVDRDWWNAKYKGVKE